MHAWEEEEGKRGQENASNPTRWEREEADRVNERQHRKHLQVNQTSGTGARSPAPHPTAPLACPGRCRAGSPGGGDAGKGSERAAGLQGPSYLEAFGEESKDDVWVQGAGAGGGRRDPVQEKVRAAAGKTGRRLSGAASLRFRGGFGASRPQRRTEPQRSGSGGLTILPRGPVPSNRHRPRSGSAGGSSLTFPAGGASARSPGPGGGGDVGRGEGREED